MIRNSLHCLLYFIRRIFTKLAHFLSIMASSASRAMQRQMAHNMCSGMVVPPVAVGCWNQLAVNPTVRSWQLVPNRENEIKMPIWPESTKKCKRKRCGCSWDPKSGISYTSVWFYVFFDSRNFSILKFSLLRLSMVGVSLGLETCVAEVNLHVY